MDEQQTPLPAESASVPAKIKSVAMKPSVIVMAIASGLAWYWLRMTPDEQAAIFALSPWLLKNAPLITLVCGIIARELPPGFFLKLFGLKNDDEDGK